jgi:hypothetical protein
MGQYWKTVNLDKREFICPHKLGGGLKLWEQANNPPGTPVALFILTAAMPVPRGGGDFQPHPAIGRWAGDRIATVGDYAEDDDLPKSKIPAGILYELCGTAEDLEERLAHLRKLLRDPRYQGGRTESELRRKLRQLRGKRSFTDVSDMVCDVIERECMGTFQGDGWRQWVPNNAESPHAMPRL